MENPSKPSPTKSSSPSTKQSGPTPEQVEFRELSLRELQEHQALGCLSPIPGKAWDLSGLAKQDLSTLEEEE